MALYVVRGEVVEKSEQQLALAGCLLKTMHERKGLKSHPSLTTLTFALEKLGYDTETSLDWMKLRASQK